MSLLGFWKDHIFANFDAPMEDLSEKTAVLTGAISGRIAYHVAVHLLRNNLSRLVIAARSVDRGKKAKATMLSEVSAYKGCIEIWSLDMADFGSCRAFARRVNCELDRIDIFLANAGTYPVTWKLTKDGYEERLQVNVIATGLLCLLVLPALAKTARSTKQKPRLSITSSAVHAWTPFKEQSEKNIIGSLNEQTAQKDIFDCYSITKLLEIYIIEALARLPIAEQVILNAVGPGLIMSPLYRDTTAIQKRITSAIGWTSEKGSRNVSWAIMKGYTSGAFVEKCQETAPSVRLVTSDNGQRIRGQVWSELRAIYKKVAPEVEPLLR
ncbi:MAG: hypothetical protein CYPHOPRED_000063 [Cyphobasidiales sp. Tagirdzhanova-0007]|nr:MAG: hypothetical protein CYPHOPRED_000063 [Cyphobasidiales sp. Tagirdzhanova-0007]